MPGYERQLFVNMSGDEANELTCSVCHQIFRNPVIADCCLQAFCEACIHEWLKKDNTCPYDRKQLTVKELRPAPRLLNNLLGKLEIHCQFRDNGCKEIIRLEDLSQHLDNCPFNLRICKTCFCVCKVTHNCVQELLDMNKKEIEVIESLKHEKEVFRKLFDDIKEKYNDEKESLLNQNTVLKKIIKGLEESHESEVQKLKKEVQELQQRLNSQSKTAQESGTLFRSSSTLSLDSRPSYHTMLSEARKYVDQRVSITESNTDEEVSKTIVDIVKNEIRVNNNMYYICQNVVYKLDLQFGSSWACIANYDKHGNNYTNSSCFVKLKFGKLTFKIYRTKFLDVALLRRRFREGKIKRKIHVFDSDMLHDHIQIVERATFCAIEKANSIKVMTKMIKSRLEDQLGGHWYCFAYSFGDYCIQNKHASFICFEIDQLKIALFQTK